MGEPFANHRQQQRSFYQCVTRSLMVWRKNRLFREMERCDVLTDTKTQGEEGISPDVATYADVLLCSQDSDKVVTPSPAAQPEDFFSFSTCFCRSLRTAGGTLYTVHSLPNHNVTTICPLTRVSSVQQAFFDRRLCRPTINTPHIILPPSPPFPVLYGPA